MLHLHIANKYPSQIAWYCLTTPLSSSKLQSWLEDLETMNNKLVWNSLLLAFVLPLYVTYWYTYAYSITPSNPPVQQGFTLLPWPMSFFIFLGILGNFLSPGQLPPGGLLSPQLTVTQILFSFLLTYVIAWIINFLICLLLLFKMQQRGWTNSLMLSFAHICLPVYGVWMFLLILFPQIGITAAGDDFRVSSVSMLIYSLIFLSLIPVLVITGIGYLFRKIRTGYL